MGGEKEATEGENRSSAAFQDGKRMLRDTSQHQTFHPPMYRTTKKTISMPNNRMVRILIPPKIRKLAEYGLGEYGFKHRTQ